MDDRHNKGHGIKMKVNHTTLLAVAIVILVMITRESGSRCRGRFHGSVPALITPGVRLPTRQEGGREEPEVGASALLL